MASALMKRIYKEDAIINRRNAIQASQAIQPLLQAVESFTHPSKTMTMSELFAIAAKSLFELPRTAIREDKRLKLVAELFDSSKRTAILAKENAVYSGLLPSTVSRKDLNCFVERAGKKTNDAEMEFATFTRVACVILDSADRMMKEGIAATEKCRKNRISIGDDRKAFEAAKFATEYIQGWKQAITHDFRPQLATIVRSARDAAA